jgi:hypothetical protein
VTLHHLAHPDGALARIPAKTKDLVKQLMGGFVMAEETFFGGRPVLEFQTGHDRRSFL